MARFENGWIKFHRRAVNEDIGWSGVQLAVWVTLLCWATRFETKIGWTGGQRTIPPGSVVTATRELSARLGFSKDAIARALRSLAGRDSIRVESAPRGTLITICNWAEYQDADEGAAPPVRHDCDSKRTLNGRQPDLNGEVENKEEIHIVDFGHAFAEYKQLPGVQKGAKAEKRFQDQIKSEDDLERLLIAIRNYRVVLSWSENAWRKPKTTFETFLGSKASGYFWHDFIQMPGRGVNGNASAAEMEF
jgi:hypothetical protein